jgi:glutamine amidotransferase
MCRLLGIRANKAVDIGFVMLNAPKPFKSFGKGNPDGWGIGYYRGHAARVVREPQNALSSKIFDHHVKRIQSNLVIGHVREASRGKNCLANTHPFIYGKWIFCHNGTLAIFEEIKKELAPKYRKRIRGTTDSEVLFYWILQHIEKATNAVDGIRSALAQIDSRKRGRTTSLNFLLSDGKTLYAYRNAYKKPHEYTLYYLHQTSARPMAKRLESHETPLEIELTQIGKSDSVIVCSEKLTTDKGWKLIPNKTLVSIDSHIRRLRL